MTTDMRDEPAARPALGELAAAGDADELAEEYTGALAVTRDDILKTRGRGDLLIYEELLRDDQVQSCWQQRVRAAIAREWVVEPGGPKRADKQAAEALKAELEAIGWDRVCAKMLHGVFYGLGVAELLWEPRGAGVAIGAIKVRRTRRFRFDRDGGLRLLRRGALEGELMPPNKFWIYTAGGADDDDRYGRGLGYHLYWYCWFKRNGLKFWSQFLDKFATPTVKAELDAGTSEEDRRKVLAVAKAVSRDSAVLIPKGVVMELLEAKRNSGGDFSGFVEHLNSSIAKIILSQTMTTDNGSSLAQAAVHQDVKMEVVKSDNDLICESFNAGPAVWWTAWNYPGAAPPKVWRLHDEPEDLKARADRDAVIRGLGFKPTLNYIVATYGDGWVAEADGGGPDPATPPPPGGEADFAERPRDAADELGDQLALLGDPALAALIGKARNELDAADSLPAFAERLLALHEGMDVGDLAGVIGPALVVANLTGRLDTEGEPDDGDRNG